MPRILAPNHSSFHRRGSQHSLSSRSSLNSEPPLRRSSLTSTRGYQNTAYESAFSLRRTGPQRRQTFDVCNTNDITQQTKKNAEWETRQPPKTYSKDSLHTIATTQPSSQNSSISTLPSTNGTSSSGLAAAFALLMQQKASGGGFPNRLEPQSAPCSPKSASNLVSSFVPYHIIKEEPDCWGQFVDVQSKDEDLNKRSRVVRRYPGAPHSLPRTF